MTKPTLHIGSIINWSSLQQCKIEGCIGKHKMSIDGDYPAVIQLLSNYHVIGLPSVTETLASIYTA